MGKQGQQWYFLMIEWEKYPLLLPDPAYMFKLLQKGNEGSRWARAYKRRQ